MKNTLLVLSLFAILLSSCGDDDDNVNNNKLSLSNNLVLITDEEAVIIDIKNSTSNNYTLTITNSAINPINGLSDLLPVVYQAVVIPETDKLYIWGNAVGEGTVTVSDGNSFATVKVKVNEYIPRAMETVSVVRMKPGGNYKITDFDPKTILFATNQDDEVVSVDEVLDGAILNALKVGESKVSFYDSKLSSHNYDVMVVDKFQLICSESLIQVQKGDEVSIRISGNGDYEIEIEDPSTTSAEIRQYTQEEKEQYERISPYGAMIDIRALELGYTKIKIKDSENQEIEVYVRVM